MSAFTSASSDSEVYSTGLYLAAVAEVIRTKGFNKQSTARDACALVIANRDEGHEFAVEDFVTAGLAIGWLSEKEGLSAFERDILVEVEKVELPVRRLNLVMYLVKMYLEVRDVKGGEYIGTLGAKVSVAVKVVSSEYSSSEWGVSYFTKAVTPDDNVVVWYAKEQLNAGDLLALTGKVKKQSEFRGVKTTTLNYVKIV